MSKNMDFCHLEETYVTNMEDDYSATKTELDALKRSTKNVPQKAAEAAG